MLPKLSTPSLSNTFRMSTDCSVQRIYPQHIGVVAISKPTFIADDFLKRMCAVRVWMQLSFRKYFWGPVFRMDTVLVRYCVSFEALLFHGCNYGIFIGWCPYSPWAANKSVVKVYCMSPGRCAPIVESQRVDDFDTDNMARTAVYQCRLNDNMTRTAVYQWRLNDNMTRTAVYQWRLNDNMTRIAVYQCRLNDNMTRIALYQCRLNYYRYRRINHVTLFVVYIIPQIDNNWPVCALCLSLLYWHESLLFETLICVSKIEWPRTCRVLCKITA
jgi:hypothetical protein